MSRQFLTSIDLNGNEIQNSRLQNLATAPSSPGAGRIYYDTTIGSARQYNGTTWVNLDPSKAANGVIPIAALTVDPTVRSNHTGTQTASTISDFNTAVRTNRLDQMAAPTADLSIGGNKLTNVATGVSGTDAVNVNQLNSAVQSSAAGIDSKPSVRVITSSNIVLSGLQTIDGVTVSANDRVLVAAQTDATTNGVYTAASGAWSRATDADQTGEITPGAFWFVEEGTTYGKTQWRCNNTGVITLGSTSITIVQFGAAAGYTQGNGIAISGNSIAVQPSTGISVTGAGVAIDTTVVARKYSQNVGDGSSTSITVTHNLGTLAVMVQLFRNSGSYETLECDVQRTSANVVTLVFASAPTASQFTVLVVG